MAAVAARVRAAVAWQRVGGPVPIATIDTHARRPARRHVGRAATTMTAAARAELQPNAVKAG
eukprot:5316294-Alexandrium_andersonii.AAC.1